MGLREEAEAARLRAEEEREREKMHKKAEQQARHEARVAEMTDFAYEAADTFGFELDDEAFTWVVEESKSLSGTYRNEWLLCRSDDGVWLKFTRYASNRMEPVKPRFEVVDKCPDCDKWVSRGMALNMAQIGTLLRAPSRVPEHQARLDHQAA